MEQLDNSGGRLPRGKAGSPGPNPMEFATLGGEMAGTAFLGYLIDLSFQTVPLWTVVGAVLGVISAGVHLFRIVGRMAAKQPPFKKP